MPIDGVLETCLYVDDLDAAERFYHQILGLAVVGRRPGRHVFFRCGNQMLLLFDPAASNDIDSDLPRHGTHGSGHVAFSVSHENLAEARMRLDQAGVVIEREIRWPRGGGLSIYFRDPAGNSLELANPGIWD